MGIRTYGLLSIHLVVKWSISATLWSQYHKIFRRQRIYEVNYHDSMFQAHLEHIWSVKHTRLCDRNLLLSVKPRNVPILHAHNLRIHTRGNIAEAIQNKRLVSVLWINECCRYVNGTRSALLDIGMRIYWPSIIYHRINLHVAEISAMLLLCGIIKIIYATKSKYKKNQQEKVNIKWKIKNITQSLIVAIFLWTNTYKIRVILTSTICSYSSWKFR